MKRSTEHTNLRSLKLPRGRHFSKPLGMEAKAAVVAVASGRDYQTGVMCVQGGGQKIGSSLIQEHLSAFIPLNTAYKYPHIVNHSSETDAT